MIPSFDHTGPFIWAAYALSALVLGGMIAAIVLRASAARARLERLQQDEDER